MKGLFLACLILTSLTVYDASAQYVVRVQKQVLYDVLNLKSTQKLILKQDSLIASLRTSVAGLEATVSSCLILNTDYQSQISSLKEVNFIDKKEIIVLHQDNRRLKRQNVILKILIPVAVAGTIYLCNH